MKHSSFLKYGLYLFLVLFASAIISLLRALGVDLSKMDKEMENAEMLDY